MKLIELELFNFCQHEHLKVQFSEKGLNGILGHNGAGKSNIFWAISYALTGALPDNLDTYIRLGKPQEDKSCVILTVMSDITGDVAKIVRSLQPREAWIETKEKKIMKASAINFYLSETMGVDPGVIKNVQIVSQESTTELFNESSTARSLRLQNMFGVKFMRQCRDNLRNTLMTVRTISDVHQQITMVQDMLNAKNKAIEAYESVPDEQTLFEEHAKLEEEKQYIESMLSQLALHNYACMQEKRAEADYHNKLRMLEDIERTPAEDYESLKREFDTFMTVSSGFDSQISNLQFAVGTAHDSLEPEITTMKDVLEQLSGYDPSMLESESVSALQKRYQEILTLRKQIAPSVETGRCPLCGREYADAQEKLDALDAELTPIIAELSAIDKFRKEHDALCERIRPLCYKYEIRGISNVKSIDNLLSERNSLVFSMPALCNDINPLTLQSRQLALAKYEKDLADFISESQAMLDTCLTRQTAFRKTESDFRHRLNVASQYAQKVAAAKMAVSTAEDYYANASSNAYLKFQLPEDFPTEEIAQQRCREIADKLISVQRDISSDAVRRQLIKDRDILDQQLQQLQAVVNSNAELTEYRDDLNQVLTLLGSDQLPRAAVLGMSVAVVSNLNTYLALFNAPFTAYMDSETNIYCNFESGDQKITVSASRLSGGQKVILALAWRLAIHSTFYLDESCGFLTLDEPTTFLDKDNIDNLVSVLQQVKTFAAEKNIQIIVITHEQSLASLFDNIIQL